MLLATIYLLVWEATALQYILLDPPAGDLQERVPLKTADLKLWQWNGLIMFMLKINLVFPMLLCLGEGMITFVIYLVVVKRRKRNHVLRDN